MTLINSKKHKDRDYSIKYIKTKKIPVEIELKRKDGKIIKIKATKIVKDSQNTRSKS